MDDEVKGQPKVISHHANFLQMIMRPDCVKRHQKIWIMMRPLARIDAQKKAFFDGIFEYAFCVSFA